MRFVADILVRATDDPDRLFELLDQRRTLDDTDAALVTHQAGVLTLTAAESDKQFGFGDVTDAKYLFIVAASEVQVRYNDVAAPLITLKPVPAVTPDPVSQIQKTARPAIVFMGPTSLQSLYFSNPDASNAVSVYVALFGEAV